MMLLLVLVILPLAFSVSPASSSSWGKTTFYIASSYGAGGAAESSPYPPPYNCTSLSLSSPSFRPCSLAQVLTYLSWDRFNATLFYPNLELVLYAPGPSTPPYDMSHIPSFGLHPGILSLSWRSIHPRNRVTLTCSAAVSTLPVVQLFDTSGPALRFERVDFKGPFGRPLVGTYNDEKTHLPLFKESFLALANEYGVAAFSVMMVLLILLTSCLCTLALEKSLGKTTNQQDSSEEELLTMERIARTKQVMLLLFLIFLGIVALPSILALCSVLWLEYTVPMHPMSAGRLPWWQFLLAVSAGIFLLFGVGFLASWIRPDLDRLRSTSAEVAIPQPGPPVDMQVLMERLEEAEVITVVLVDVLARRLFLPLLFAWMWLVLLGVFHLEFGLLWSSLPLHLVGAVCAGQCFMRVFFSGPDDNNVLLVVAAMILGWWNWFWLVVLTHESKLWMVRFVAAWGWDAGRHTLFLGAMVHGACRAASLASSSLSDSFWKKTSPRHWLYLSGAGATLLCQAAIISIRYYIRYAIGAHQFQEALLWYFVCGVILPTGFLFLLRVVVGKDIRLFQSWVGGLSLFVRHFCQGNNNILNKVNNRELRQLIQIIILTSLAMSVFDVELVVHGSFGRVLLLVSLAVWLKGSSEMILIRIAAYWCVVLVILRTWQRESRSSAWLLFTTIFVLSGLSVYPSEDIKLALLVVDPAVLVVAAFGVLLVPAYSRSNDEFPPGTAHSESDAVVLPILHLS